MRNETGSSKAAVPVRRMFRPVTDIYETPVAYVVLAEIPGAGVDRADISVENGRLKMAASGAPDAREETILRSEYTGGDYRMELTLPDDVDAARISAAVKNGVLKLTLQKTKEETKRIPVSA